MRYLIYYKLKFATKMRDNTFLSKCKVPFYSNKSYTKNGKGRSSFVISAKKRARQSKINAFALQSVAKSLCKATA